MLVIKILVQSSLGSDYRFTIKTIGGNVKSASANASANASASASDRATSHPRIQTMWLEG